MHEQVFVITSLAADNLTVPTVVPMGLSGLLTLVPLPVILSFITSAVIPEISAFFTRKPNGATGLITIVLSIVSAICSNLAMPHADWKVAVGTAIVTWFLASKWHTKILSDSEIEKILHASGPFKGQIPVTRAHGIPSSAPKTPEVGSAASLPRPPKVGE